MKEYWVFLMVGDPEVSSGIRLKSPMNLLGIMKQMDEEGYHFFTGMGDRPVCVTKQGLAMIEPIPPHEEE